MTTAEPRNPVPVDATPGPIYIDTQHEDMVHDAQMDYYGSKLATCSSDRTIKIYNVSENAYELSATIQGGHEGPVWQVSWAHPKFGVLLASCSFDGSVLLHREVRPREWTVIHAARHLHESSVNGVAFAPHEHGLLVAAASSDGRVSVLQHEAANNTWGVHYLSDCPLGVNAVSWAPWGAFYQADQVEAPRLVTAGCDNQIRFWICKEGQWTTDSSIVLDVSEVAHKDWVRDVAWSPVLLPNHNMVASCSEDGSVIVWTQVPPANVDGDDTIQESVSQWKPTLLHKYDTPVWRVSWSLTGHLLAVSAGDSDVTLWKAGLDGAWSQVSTVDAQPTSQGQ
jgi:protein transport protein SEC13